MQIQLVQDSFQSVAPIADDAAEDAAAVPA